MRGDTSKSEFKYVFCLKSILTLSSKPTAGSICCCSSCCLGYATEVCKLVIRSRQPGRHRAEALAGLLVLAISQQSSLQSFFSITATERQSDVRSLCDLPARTVLHNGLCSLSFAYVCVADRGQMLDPHKNCPHTP